MYGTDLVIILATRDGIHLFTYFECLKQIEEALGNRISPDRKEVFPWEVSTGLKDNSEGWFPALPWNVPSDRTEGLVPVQCAALVNDLIPVFLPQWFDPKKLVERGRKSGENAGCNVGALIRPPGRTWVCWNGLEMLKSSTSGLYMVWVHDKREGGEQTAELYLIGLEGGQGGFEEVSRKLKVPVVLENVSYIVFSEEGGLLAMTVEEDGATQRIHLFYY